MENDKRFLMALALTFGFLFLWFEYFVPKPIPKESSKVVENVSSVDEKDSITEDLTATRNTPTETKVKREEPEITIGKDTAELSMTWSNQPGGPKRIGLRNFRETIDPNSKEVDVVPFQGEAPEPLLWTFAVSGEESNDTHAVYRKVSEGLREIRFEQELAEEGLRVEKNYEWEESSYAIKVRVNVVNQNAEPIKVLASTTLSSRYFAPKKSSFFSMFSMQDMPVRAVAYINEKTVRWTTEEIEEKEEVPQGDIRWAGFDTRYFLLTAIPQEGRWKGLELNSTKLATTEEEGSGGGVNTVKMVYPTWEIPAGGSQSYSLKLYAGPKDIESLQALSVSLDRAIDLGNWLGPIARPIMWFLRWLHSFLPNFGVAIILLTVLVRLLMYPLTQKQAKSMKRMQEHKPQMDALKEKCGKDKEAYSREVMNYMRTHKINPMGGCLLLLPQLPVFFALYRVLYNSIELRHAPFVFWIRDLAAHDPYFVMPVLLGITMFMQQRLTPTPTADPAQQTLMKIMPVMFTAFMLFLPAGLNLYIFVSTLWGVGQQYWIQRGITPAVVKTGKARRN